MAKSQTAIRKKPDFSGVTGDICDISGMNLVFGDRKRKSPYDELLDRLVAETEKAAGEGRPVPALCFRDVKCRTSVGLRSRKKGLSVEIAESDGKLYVRLKEDLQAPRLRRKGALLKLFLPGRPLTHIAAAAKLRDAGDTAADAQIVFVLLQQLVREGELVQQEGNAFAINPRRKVASHA